MREELRRSKSTHVADCLQTENSCVSDMRLDRVPGYHGACRRSAKHSQSPRAAVQLFESVLRDGEQGARRCFSPSEKARVAAKLERDVLGRSDVIDAGFIGRQNSPVDLHGVAAVLRATDAVTVNVLCHGTDVRDAARALSGHESRARISTFHRPMELSGRHDAAESRRLLLRSARSSVSHAAALGVREVQYYMTYAGNRDWAFLADLAHEAAIAGATHVVIADSQSSLLPDDTYRLTKTVCDAVELESCEIGFHGHNAAGLALANAISAVNAGAMSVESCLLGLGDAGGNLASEQFIAAAMRFGKAREAAFAVEASLPGAVALGEEVSAITGFTVGENQPLCGERAFDVNTGIHQNNAKMFSTAVFDPSAAGRRWSVKLNRHSSRGALLEALAAEGEENIEHDSRLITALVAWMRLQNESIEKGEAARTAAALRDAWDAMVAGRTLLIPTTVGWTLASLPSASGALIDMKSRDRGKPNGVMASTDLFGKIFEAEPPSALEPFMCVAFLSTRVRRGAAVPPVCRSSGGHVGVWVGLGPVAEYLAARAWHELGECIVGSSANRAGAGNPRAQSFSVDAIDDALVASCHVVNIDHWGTPETDADGRWLSAPIIDLDSGELKRKGRDMDSADAVLADVRAMIKSSASDGSRRFNPSTGMLSGWASLLAVVGAFAPRRPAVVPVRVRDGTGSHV